MREQALQMMLHSATPIPTIEKISGTDTLFSLRFTKKEMSIMPQELQERLNEARRGRWIRQKANGIYEIRMSISGVQFYASAKDLAVAKRKFLDAVRCETGGETMPIMAKKRIASGVTFGEFADRWLTVTKKPRVKEITYEEISLQLKNHLLPRFGEVPITDIHTMEIDEFINSYIERGQARTALKLYVTLKDIFNCATLDEVIKRNPAEKIQKPTYEAKSGAALSREEEFELVNKLFENNDPCRYAIVFILYTGMRRSELKSASTDGVWITVSCAKTRKGKERTRKVPITPMLRPYIEHFTKVNLCFTDDRLSRVVPKYLEGHTTHHLRHTFITRAQECGVSKEIVKLWVGHSANKRDMTESVYTHFSEEFQLSEATKISYEPQV